MITLELALTEDSFHYGKRALCKQLGKSERWRRNGATKTWKTRPGEFRIPIKHGLYTYGEITDRTAYMWHTSDDCALNAKSDPMEAQSCLPF